MNKKRLIITVIVILVFTNILILTPFGKTITVYVVNGFEYGVNFVGTKFNEAKTYVQGINKANNELQIAQQNQEVQKANNSQLSAQNSQLKAQQEALEKQLAGNNEILTSINSFGGQATIINGQITIRNINQWNSTATINIGSKNGNIKVGQPVIAQNSLVGFVTQVNDTNSEIELITNGAKDLNIPVMVINGKEEVNMLLTKYDPSTNEYVIKPINYNQILEMNSQVLTNGYQPEVMKGINIGRITKQEMNSKTGEISYRIKSSIDINNIRLVGVVVNG